VNGSLAKLMIWLAVGLGLFSLFNKYEGMQEPVPTMSYSKLMEETAAKRIAKVDIVRQAGVQILTVKTKEGKEYTLVIYDHRFNKKWC
jgi:ATP-dependent Zn protease